MTEAERPEILTVDCIADLRVFDGVDEGRQIISIYIGDRSEAHAVPGELVAEWIPELDRCMLAGRWDGDEARVITSADLPVRVIRPAPPPPIRCALEVEPCERCPRR